MRARPASLALVLLALPAASAAQGGAPALDPGRPLSQYTLDAWTERDGLPQDYVSSIVQTPDGYLWLGTEEGLVRFDGVRFTVYTPATTPALSTPWVTTLWADADGTLWIGTGGGGVVRMRDGEWKAYTTEQGLSHDFIRALFRDSRGALWIGTGGGGADRIVEDTVETLDAGDDLPNRFVLAITEDTAGAVWLGTADGLARVRGSDLRVFTRGDGLGGNHVYDLLTASDGSLWIATADGGVTRMQEGRFRTYGTRDGLSGDFVTRLYEDGAGTIWIGTNGAGLNRLVDDRITSLTSGEGLPSDLVWALAGDREGNLWVGLNGGGLLRMQDGSFTTVGEPDGLSADIALAVLEDRQGALWVGTAGGGVNRLHDGRISTLTTADGLAHDVVVALAEAGNGDIWAGMVARGVSRIGGGRIRTYGLADGLVSTQVNAILEDREGVVWLGTSSSGLQRWRPGPSVTYSTADGLPDDHVTSLIERAAGGLWVGTRGGLAKLEDGRITPVAIGKAGQPTNVISSLYEDAEGALWVSTFGGIARFRDGRVSLYGESAGLQEREMHRILEDAHGYLWISSNQGIFRVRKADLDAFDDGRLPRVPVDRFGRGDGLRSPEANGGIHPAGIRRRDGTVWFPTMKGVARVDPARLELKKPLQLPLIERLVAGDTIDRADTAIVLPVGSRTLEFHFTSPTFVAADEIRFRYRLDGFDVDWVEAHDRRVAYYTNVPPGTYRFRVAARRPDGPWLATEAVTDVAIAPRFYERTAFMVLVALALFFTAAGIYRLRIRWLQRRQEELLALVEARERSEQALRRSEERLRLALEGGRLVSWEWEVPSGAVSASRGAQELLGFTADTFPELCCWLEAHVAPADLPRLLQAEKRLHAGRDHVDLNFAIAASPGELRHVEVRGRAVRDPSGRLLRVTGVAADVTESTNARAALHAREEELRQAQKMEAVGRLAGGVAHDFNNILTTIAGRAQFLLDGLGPGHDLGEDALEVQRAAERARKLTQQLLTFSRKQVLQPRLLDLNAVIEGVEDMLRRLIREDITVETRLDPALRFVRADQGGIEQILVNLVVNARDAMPDGGQITIETSLATGAEAGGPAGRLYARLSVTDTGHGMDAQTIKRIFEPFFTTKEVGKGTGLGLATVYGIVEQSDGLIHAESTVGVGTCFAVYLPHIEQHAGEPVDPAGGAPSPEPTERIGPASAGATSEAILLVEDEDAVRSLARKVLERHGYRVLEASTGDDALTLCADSDTRIDLLISDVVMPGIGGRELAERARSLRPGLPVLLMSGYNEDEVLRAGVLTPGIAFLEKPFQPATLVRRIGELLSAHTAA